jgi:predicted RNase H-like HicB family nuclease
MKAIIMNFNIEYEQEEDGRWLAEVVGLPGVLTYGNTADEAMIKAEILALKVLVEKLEQEESRPQPINISCVAA